MGPLADSLGISMSPIEELICYGLNRCRVVSLEKDLPRDLLGFLDVILSDQLSSQ